MARPLTARSAFDGETLAGTFKAPAGTTAVVLKLADGAKTATARATANADGTWTATLDPSALAGFHGPARWIAYATTPTGTEAFATGDIYFRSLISPYRAVVAAVEQAIQNYGNNPNKSISVGDLSITYKDYADLLSILAYWKQRVRADEAGMEAKTGGVQFLKVRF